ncbi:unnamed protein product [Brugia pahangi]|uniref:TackOD1 domain-containing protein n=1 Tax=Brugia pahangi TaxID=6280 RepID=A0A0N4T3C3_BRUPA|nr:unnamed protein product [Brugia pahangi]
MNAKELLNEYGAQIGQRSSLLHPHDSCSVIAQQTFGTVFSLKYGFTIAASRIAYKRESYCFNCQCTIDRLFARNICRPCEAVEPAELKYGFTIAASRIAYKRENYCFNCQCTIDRLFARNICRPCEAVEPAELVSYRMIDSEPDNDPQFLDLFI